MLDLIYVICLLLVVAEIALPTLNGINGLSNSALNFPLFVNFSNAGNNSQTLVVFGFFESYWKACTLFACEILDAI